MNNETTRGMSFDPKEAAAQRAIRQARERALQSARAKRAAEAARQERREFGRKLDQIETCYRQYRPKQVHEAAVMVTCENEGLTPEAVIRERDNCNFWFNKTDEHIVGADYL